MVTVYLREHLFGDGGDRINNFNLHLSVVFAVTSYNTFGACELGAEDYHLLVYSELLVDCWINRALHLGLNRGMVNSYIGFEFMRVTGTIFFLFISI